VTLATGEKVTVDEAYIRESILNPTAKLVSGFAPLMPTFQGVVSEEQIAQLTAYIKSLNAAPAGAPGGAAGATPATPAPAGAAH
jgi:cytochrome c oxidase subunit 2